MHVHPRFCGLLACLPLCAAPFVIAQQSISNQSPVAADAATTTVTVTVTGSDHRPVSGLKAEGFTIYQDGQRLSISSVEPADTPACVAIVADESASMRDKLAAIASAMGDFVRAGNPGNQILPVAFNDETTIKENFTADAALVEKGLMREDARGGTALYDAVMGTADYLAKSKECNKRVLVVLSDGEDTKGQKTLEAALAFLQCAGNPLIYAIGLPHPDRAISSRGRHALEVMANRSGGAAFFIERFNELHQAALKVADELKNQYAVTYVAARTGGPDIKIEAHTSGQKNMSIRSNMPGTTDLSAGESAYREALSSCVLQRVATSASRDHQR
jgi:Ca-activated chloride channel family protein